MSFFSVDNLRWAVGIKPKVVKHKRVESWEVDTSTGDIYDTKTGEALPADRESIASVNLSYWINSNDKIR